MEIKRQFAAAVLCAALAVLPLAGCTQKDAPDSPGEVAMGRYVETDWELPGIGTGYAALHRSHDGKIALLAIDEDEVQKYYTTADGIDWQEDPPDWYVSLMEKASVVSSVHFNSKGEGVALYYPIDDLSYMSKVALIGADGSITLTPIGDNGTPWTDGEIRHFVRSSGTARSGNSAEEDGGDGEEDERSELVYHAGENGVAAVTTDSLEPADDLLAEEDVSESEKNTSRLSSLFIDDADNGPAPLYLRKVYRGEDGLVYAGTYQETGCFDPVTGELITSYEKGAADYTLVDGQLAELLYEPVSESDLEINGPSMVFADMDSASLVRTLPADIVARGGDVLLESGEDGSLFMAHSAGLYRLAPGGEIWEELVNSGLTSLSLPSLYMQTLLPLDNDEFLLLFAAMDAPRLVHYGYSADTPTLPDMELDVYELTHNQLLPQAVGTFRKSYPNVLVNIRSASDAMGENAISGSEAITALNTELLAGKGPDLFVLDNMPIESYIEKGVLADLTDVVQPMVDSGELYSGIAGAYQRDGKLFAVPSRIQIPTLWGDPEALQTANSLASLAEYAKQHPDSRLFYDLSPELLTYAFGRTHQADFIGSNGKVNVDFVEAFLTDIKELSDSGGGVLHPDGITHNRSNEEWYRSAESDGIFGVAFSRVSLLYSFLDGFQDLMAPNGVVYRQSGGVSVDPEVGTTTVPDDQVNDVFRVMPSSGGNPYIPTGIIGINASSDQQELAQEFVRALLSEATQSTDTGNGFPVNTRAVDNIINMDQMLYVVSAIYVTDDGSGDGGEYLEMSWPSEAMLQAFADTIETLDTPIGEDYSLLGMIIDAAEPFFEGQITARQAAEDAAAKASLSLSE